MRSVLRVSLALFLLLALVGWLGFVMSLPLPPPSVGPSQVTESTVLYDGLPPGLQFYLTQTVSRTPPITTTAVLWGTGSVRFDVGPISLWVPLSWQEAIDVGRGFVWRAEVRWWRWPIFRAVSTWSDGKGVLRIRDRELASPWLNQGQMMRSKAEHLWLPSALLTDPDLQWVAPDSWTAAMRYEGPLGADSLIARFDRRTHALSVLSGMRCRTDSARVRWSVHFSEWDAPGGLTVPVVGAVSWEDEPYYRFRVAGIAYNVPVEGWFSEADRTGSKNGSDAPCKGAPAE